MEVGCRGTWGLEPPTPNPSSKNTPNACPTCNPATSPAHPAKGRPEWPSPEWWELVANKPQPPWAGRWGGGGGRQTRGPQPKKQKKPQTPNCICHANWPETWIREPAWFTDIALICITKPSPQGLNQVIWSSRGYRCSSSTDTEAMAGLTTRKACQLWNRLYWGRQELMC